MRTLVLIEGSGGKERIEVEAGQSVTVGRTAQADIVFGQDAYMSALHFRIRNENGTLLLENLSRTNGTLVNGRRVESVVLVDGDRITAGRTVFLVTESARDSTCALRLGSWRLGKIPDGWEVVEGVGVCLAQKAPFRASMIAVEEPLPEGTDLAGYVEVQRNLIRTQLKNAQMSDCRPVPLQGVEQAVLMDVYTPAPEGGRICQRQLYTLSKGVVGVFTITLADHQMEQLREAQSIVMSNLSFMPE